MMIDADESHEMSCLIFSEKYTVKKIKMLSATVVIRTLRVTV